MLKCGILSLFDLCCGEVHALRLEGRLRRWRAIYGGASEHAVKALKTALLGASHLVFNSHLSPLRPPSVLDFTPCPTTQTCQTDRTPYTSQPAQMLRTMTMIRTLPVARMRRTRRTLRTQFHRTLRDIADLHLQSSLLWSRDRDRGASSPIREESDA